jgi:cytohesin|tara:strand:- start:19585 stop:19959 length:375 start_codon:yes stop_codon:yes gene_type:complete
MKVAWGGHGEVQLWALVNGCRWADEACTLLFIAAGNGHEAVVRALIELGADVNKTGENGATALYTATDEGHEAVVRALIEAGAGADVNKATDEKAWKNGSMLLHNAAYLGHEAIVQILRDAGAV